MTKNALFQRFLQTDFDNSVIPFPEDYYDTLGIERDIL